MSGAHDLLRRCVEAGASDLHLGCGLRPTLRVDGVLRPLDDVAPLDEAAVEAAVRALLTPRQVEAFVARRAVDAAVSLGPGQRFRVNAFTERGRPAVAVRRLDERLRALDELRLPPSLARLADLDEGLVLVVGPTGSGKSTTLATIIDLINREQAAHVITLEDPVEYEHTSRRSVVRQRELHTDFDAFPEALRAALREDPDVLLVGEMRDRATMRAALMAAETGHLVFSTLHTGSAVGAAERLVGAFRSTERDAVRHQLSLVLRAVVAQRLLPSPQGRVAVVEVLWATPAVANLIRTGKTNQLRSAMEGGAAGGMLTFEQSLADAVVRGWLAEDEARRAAREAGALDERLRILRARPAATARPASSPAWRPA
ncbi:MAG: PilT/PilU family type 4a pilus ATPase [Planctomycetes bacterium]|nr:PilT/PilU family type 4a pilus ATPase [Planctomycetota bacterium]